MQLVIEQLISEVDDLSKVEGLTDEESEEISSEYSITSYGADYPVDGLVKRINEESIVIPQFQRDFVWTIKQASRFVESLLLGLPVPGVFFSREQNSQKLLVIDGQQRLKTLQFFYGGVFTPTSRAFALSGLESRFEHFTYKTLLDEDRRRLDDAILHATVVKQDEPTNDDSSIYNIFERLNTGGTLLAPQQIRASIYHGPFNDLLGELNKNSDWRSIFGATNKYMRDQELILRFFALYYNAENYRQPMKGFLNSYMEANKTFKLQSSKELTKIFDSTIEVINVCFEKQAFRPERALNAAVFDAVMIGLANRLQLNDAVNFELIKSQYEKLVQDSAFKAATERATSDETRVSQRLRLAKEAFSAV